MKKITYLLLLVTLVFSWQGYGQLSENFDGGTFPPLDWTMTAGSGSIDQSSQTADHTTGSDMFARYDCYNTSGSSPAYLTSPRLVVSSTDKTYSFWVNSYLPAWSGSGSPELYVDVSSDGGTTWISGTANYISGQNDNGWLQTTLDLTSFQSTDFTGTDTYVRFKTISDYGYYNIGIDDVSGPAVFVPSCFAPNTLTATSITTTSASLGWTLGDSENTWNVEYGADGFTQGTGTMVTGTTTNPYAVSGLTSGTAYDFYVQADCSGDTSAWVGPYSFTTLSDYCAGDHFYDSGGVSGNYSNNENITTVISPTTSGDAVTVTFSSYATETGYDKLKIYDGPDATATLLIDHSGSSIPGPFTSTHASGSLTFVFTSDSSSNASGWDATVVCAPLPLAPLCAESPTPAIAAVDVTATNGRVALAWDAPSTGDAPTSYKLFWGTDPGALTDIFDTANTSVPITGLTYSTTYYWQIVPSNVGGSATGCTVWSFTTEDAPPPPAIATGVTLTSAASAIIVFSEDFEDNSAGWTGNVGVDNGEWEIPDGATSTGTGAADGYLGGNFMNYEASDVDSNQGSIVSPAIDLSAGIEAAELSFWMHAYGNTMGTLNVGVGTSATGSFTTEFTWTGQYQTSDADAWINVGVDLTAYLGSTIYIELTQIDDQAGFKGDMSIDAFQVETGTTVLSVEDTVIEGFSLYPNPVNDRLHLTALDNIDELSVYNLLGQEVLRTQPKVLSTQVDMSNLPTGMYVVKVKVGDQLGSYRIIKE